MEEFRNQQKNYDGLNNMKVLSKSIKALNPTFGVRFKEEERTILRQSPQPEVET